MNLYSGIWRRALALGIALGALPAFGAPGFETPRPKARIDFEKSVLPILQRSCFACHAPALSAKPAIPPDPVLTRRQEVEIDHGVDALEMGAKFPFPDDRPPVRQLNKLDKVLRRGLMPPENQKKLGLGSPLTEEERQWLRDWISQLRLAVPG